MVLQKASLTVCFICVEKQEPNVLETWEYFTVLL